ncbi:1,4-dihydroxy-2-naphthoate octaprenyltransferase [Halarchaeum acidiphilum MH1-52-1]|uniref:1,4-dihydroxy-2-naphthoate octaprenyltransferase n=1 Tax=Halarchaeum acidiphilum MH1-52-1 TaxID=1261545 RepID=U2YGH0_9EURY|nr:1,4-dihydroxy-2-naphthoate polyprenyltransferase [Halarchaeum acidiphilum]GAD53361.1 1,4-dihydroxy-2-naphthoate octaprenyltransferase [Halarchaeum acidiphilum MH1-52-1]
MSDVDVSRRRAWLMAARPHTLPAGISPVVVGVGIAYALGVFAALPALAALVGALLIQIGANFANDYYDAINGADTEEREGFTRVTQSGMIEAAEVKRAMYLTFLAAMVVGLYLVYVGGLTIVVVGLASIAAGIAYTGGPFPFGYHGLGDVFVFLFFGVIAVVGTVYVQAAAYAPALPLAPPAGTLPTAAFVASVGVACISTAILVVNNLRDIETDRRTGKYTLAVRIGYTWSRVEYVALLVVAYLVPCWFVANGFGVATLLPWLSLPLAASVARTVCRHDDADHLDPALTRTGQTLALYSVLFAVGVAL